MRLRSLVVLAAAFVLSSGAFAGWPRHDMNRDGVINFADLTQAVQSGDYQLVNMVLSHWGQDVLTTPTGAPNAPGADAKAIARWNMVPWQTMTGEFNVGVVAFHINGISAVSFSVNGGAWVDVTEMTLNPESDTHEYWIRVDPSDYADGDVEIRAVAFPVHGLPRGLVGRLDSQNVSRGTHSLSFFANSGGTLPEATVYVSGVGDDLTGDGTVTSPFRTFGKAIVSRVRNGSSLTGDSAGLRVKCLPGDYVFGRSGYTFRANSFDGRWITIEAAHGVEPSQVRIVSHETGGIFADRLRLKGIRIEGPRRLLAGSLWLDGADINGHDPSVDYKVISPAWTPNGIFVTHVKARNSRNAIRDATYTYGTTVETVSGSPFGGTGMTVNSHCVRYQYAGFHGDVFHWHARPDTDPDRNIIVYNVSAPDFNTQGIAADLLGGTRIDNVAIVNFLAMKRTDSSAGSWWNTDTNHLLLRGITMSDQLLRFAQSSQNTSLRNVELHGVVVRAFTHTPLPVEARAEGIHIVDSGVYGSFVPMSVDHVTFGDPRFVDPDAGDFRPRSDSPLAGRVTARPGGLCSDAFRNTRSSPTSSGAVVSVLEE